MKKTTDSDKTGNWLKGKKDEAWHEHLNTAMTETYALLGEMVISLMDTSYMAENEEPSKTTTYDQSDGEVQDDDENNNAGGSTDCRKWKLSVKPHKKGKVVRSLTQCQGQLVNGIKTLADSLAVRHKKRS